MCFYEYGLQKSTNVNSNYLTSPPYSGNQFVQGKHFQQSHLTSTIGNEATNEVPLNQPYQSNVMINQIMSFDTRDVTQHLSIRGHQSSKIYT